MKTLALLALLLAQDRTVTVAEASVTPLVAHIYFEGANCRAVIDQKPIAGLVPDRNSYLIGGIRCTTLKALALAAAKLDAQVGDGSAP